ncbi:hypothetical protein JCGZ_12714 [Jatropha curcas]|uniref:Uncharacterized protein n=1 Tax=Jatropha curcas TaxID=180498 RepID=A0A067KAM1_JATCU|nr:hypothetical protein JCGZ_12714 [Jatropha curcas]
MATRACLRLELVVLAAEKGLERQVERVGGGPVVFVYDRFGFKVRNGKLRLGPRKISD